MKKFLFLAITFGISMATVAEQPPPFSKEELQTYVEPKWMPTEVNVIEESTVSNFTLSTVYVVTPTGSLELAPQYRYRKMKFVSHDKKANNKRKFSLGLEDVPLNYEQINLAQFDSPPIVSNEDFKEETWLNWESKTKIDT